MRIKDIYVGMDVHEETTGVALAHGWRHDKVETLGTYSSELDLIRKLLFAYESGPARFWLQRRLAAWGEDCGDVGLPGAQVGGAE